MLALMTALLVLIGATPGSTANGAVNYSYDSLGRLTMASYDTGACVAYSYDANGNRIAQTISVGGSSIPGVWGCFVWGNGKW